MADIRQPSLDELIRLYSPKKAEKDPNDLVQAGLTGLNLQETAKQKMLQQMNTEQALAVNLAELRRDKQNDAMKQQLELSKLGLLKDQNDIKREKIKKAPDSNFTEAQKAADKAFGKEFNDYVAQGGAAGIAGSKEKLDKAINKLQAIEKERPLDQGLLRASAVLPNSIQGLVTPEYRGIEQDIRSNVLGLLRQTLGPQFTKDEGEKIFAQTFDPSLPVSQNIERARVLQRSLEASANAKEAAINYYRQKGTLAGFQGATPTVAGDPLKAKRDALRAKLRI